MGAGPPKQYSKINGISVFHHTLGKICNSKEIYKVVAGISADDLFWEREPFHHPAFLGAFIGGKNRSDTVHNGLKDLLEYRQADANDWVVVHDAARPCFAENDIDRLINEARSNGIGAVLGARIVDTIKQADSRGKVIETVDRNDFWRAFTPQVFRIGSLVDALGSVIASGIDVTDECMAMEYAGYSPVMVQGDLSNIKITVPDDLELAALFMNRV